MSINFEDTQEFLRDVVGYNENQSHMSEYKLTSEIQGTYNTMRKLIKEREFLLQRIKALYNENVELKHELASK